MKKIKQILSITLGVLFLGACSNKFEEDIFDKSASERIEASITEYHKILTSASNGWLLEYYPGGTDQSFGGYNYVLDFTETEVTAMLDLSGTTVSRTSSYNIIANGGATLTVDSYNEIFHLFATPDSNNYNALQGDFEFLFLSHTDDEIILKGKKFGSEMRMFKLKESGTDYLNAVINISNNISNGFKRVSVGGSDVEFSLTARHLTYTDTNSNETVSVPFVVTDKGIRFYKPISVNGKEVNELAFDKDDFLFKNADGSFIIELYPPAPLDFKNSVWGLYADDSNKTSQVVIDIFNQVHADNVNAVANVTMDLSSRILLGDRTPQNRGIGIEFFSFVLYPSGWASVYHVSFYGDKTNPNKLYMEFLGTGAGALSGMPHYFPLRDVIVNNAPYIVEPTADDKIFLLTSEANPNVWFTLTKLR